MCVCVWEGEAGGVERDFLRKILVYQNIVSWASMNEIHILP